MPASSISAIVATAANSILEIRPSPLFQRLRETFAQGQQDPGVASGVLELSVAQLPDQSLRCSDLSS